VVFTSGHVTVATARTRLRIYQQRSSLPSSDHKEKSRAKGGKPLWIPLAGAESSRTTNVSTLS